MRDSYTWKTEFLYVCVYCVYPECSRLDDSTTLSRCSVPQLRRNDSLSCSLDKAETFRPTSISHLESQKQNYLKIFPTENIGSKNILDLRILLVLSSPGDPLAFLQLELLLSDGNFGEWECAAACWKPKLCFQYLCLRHVT